MKIKEIFIKNFGKIEMQRLESMGKVNFIIGGSNSGKTTLLFSLLAAFFPGDKRYIRDCSEEYSVKIGTDIGIFEVKQSDKKTLFFLNESPVSRNAYLNSMNFDRNLALYCLSPVRFDEQPASFRKNIVSTIAGISSDYNITAGEAREELETIDIEEVNSIIKKSAERKAKLAKIDSDIKANEIRSEAYKLYIDCLRQANRDLGSENIAKEILNNEHSLEIVNCEMKLRKEKREELLGEGVDANFAMNRKLRYEFLKTIVEQEDENNLADAKLKELKLNIFSLLQKFGINDLEMDIENYNLFAKGHNKDRMSSSHKFIVDLILKKIVAENFGIKTIVIDNSEILDLDLFKTLTINMESEIFKDIDTIMLSKNVKI